MEACTIGAIFERKNGKPAVCVHCGYCVDYCPHGVLEYKEIEVEEFDSDKAKEVGA